MTISVIIPAFNAAKYLQAAVGSVFAQTIPATQVIVVDDGSIDETASVAACLPVQVVRKAHSGISATRNTGIEQATGQYLAFLDADDLWLPDKLEKQLAMLTSLPGATGVFGKVRQFVSPEIPHDLRARFHVPDELMSGHVAGCLLIEREAFMRVGLFDESLPGGEFIDWLTRARRKGLELPELDELVLLRRIHGANTVLTSRQAMGNAYLQIVRKHLRRT